MYSREDSIRVIDKLIELTQHNKLNWSEVRPRSYMLSPGENVDIIYRAQYQQVYINVYKRRFRYYYDDTDYSWDDEVIVELVNEDGASLSRLPDTPNASELLSSIQYQSQAVQSFYNNILNSR
ncbi:hypothetical protein NJ8700_11105 [Aggregatibacter aphrophilus NJ8700]|uniref:hypothetical protein n=1 Tax=Aggregatibacter aphrophilus TaxID=732 RepID=UPI00022FEEEB|nr:hypothetical protein [Aggregatibacter aphrophilus]AKS65908.1 hypothetical protein NJ8700_11105 [Aggregatibacter aphrophilus NJ8700]EHB89893.1 hypothetical protein HMPREF9335_01210 [Aggregatibacter aphrophilus F0387]